MQAGAGDAKGDRRWGALPVVKSVVDNGIEDQAVAHEGGPPEFEHVDWLQDGVWTTEVAETERERLQITQLC